MEFENHNCGNGVGAGIPRPHPLPRRLGGEYPPLQDHV